MFQAYMDNHAKENPLHLTYLIPLFLFVDRYVSTAGAQERDSPPRMGEYVALGLGLRDSYARHPI